MPSLTKVQTGFIEPQGAFPIDTGTAAAPGLKFSDSAATGIFSPSTGVFGISTGSTQQALTILANGNVGIGETNPSGNLNISYLQVGKSQISSDHSLYNYNSSFANNAYQSGNGVYTAITSRPVGIINIVDNNLYFYNSAGAGTAGQTVSVVERFRISSTGYLGLSNFNGTAGLGRIELGEAGRQFIEGYDTGNAGSGSYLRFGDGTTERLRITSGGNIGIGTDDPDGKLNIYSTNPTRVVIEGDGSSTASAALVLKSNDADSNYRATGVFYYDTISQTEWFSGRPYTGSDKFAIHRKTNLGGSTGNTTAHPDNSLFVINSSGNIGIGTDSPQAKLHLSSGGEIRINNPSNGNFARIQVVTETVANAADLTFHVGSGEALRIANVGDVGIGTDNPGAKLHIRTASGTDTPGSSNSHLLFDLADDGGPGWVQRVWDTGAGTAGLDGSFALDRRYNGVWTNAITIKRSNGNIGIGTTDPISELMVENTTQSHITVKTSGSNMAKFGSKGNDVYIGGTAGAANIIFKRNIVSTDHPADSGTETLRIDSGGTIFINGDGSGGRIYAANSKLYLQSGNGRQSFNISDMAAGSTATHEFNSSGNLSLAGAISAKDYVNLTDTDTSARLNAQTDISGNYTGWKERNVASGSMSQTSIDSQTPTINDFTYPNNSDGLLIWSTSKIGFAAGSESPQYGTGVQMLYDASGIALGGYRAFDRTHSVSGTGNATIKLFSQTGSAFFGMNNTGLTSVVKAFTTGHDPANRGSEIRLGMTDGSFAGLRVQTLQGSNASFNSQNVSLLTHNGAIAGDYPSVFCKYDGQVGIGTTDPCGKLTVLASNASSVSTEDYNTTAAINIFGTPSHVRLQLGTGTGSLGPFGGWIQASYDNTPGSDPNATGSNGVEPLLLNPIGGNVGIGTTNPSAELHVDGLAKLGGGNEVSIGYAPSYSSGFYYNNISTDNHATFTVGLNAICDFSGSSGNFNLRQVQNHSSIGLAAMHMPGNNSSLVNNILFYSVAGPSTAGNTISQGSWDLRIHPTGVQVAGSFSKGSGSFKINHPLPEKSETHDLVHSFVESPQANNIYRGKVTLVNGHAAVNLDEVSGMTEGTFVLLNRDIHCFTSNETDWDNVKSSVTENILTIISQNENSSATVSWLVIGERQDKHMYDTDWTDENGKVIVEPLKESF